MKNLNLPTGWEVKKLGEVGIFQYGYTTSATENNTEIKYLRITDISEEGLVLWKNVPYCNIPQEDYEKYQLLNGDILFSGIGATTRKSCFITNHYPKVVFASYLIRFKANKGLHTKFTFYYTQSDLYWKQINAEKEGKQRKGVNTPQLKSLSILLPPLAEQKKIASVLSCLDEEIEHLSTQLELFKKQKKGLMQKLLTGQVRVNV